MFTLILIALALLAVAGIIAGVWHVAQGGFIGTLIGFNAIQSGFELLGQVVAAVIEAAADAAK